MYCIFIGLYHVKYYSICSLQLSFYRKPVFFQLNSRLISKLYVVVYRWRLQFIQSEFRGQLPKPYEKGAAGTRVIPSHMNDMNVEEPTRYVSLDEQDM